MFPLTSAAGSLQGHWWGLISRNYEVWPTFSLMNVFIALKGTHFLIFISHDMTKILQTLQVDPGESLVLRCIPPRSIPGPATSVYWAIQVDNASHEHKPVNTDKRITISREGNAFLYTALIELFEPQHDKTNKMTCVPSEDSDQPGHPPSLIRVFAVSMKKPWVRSFPFSTQRLGGCQGWSESSLGAQVILLVLSCCGSLSFTVSIIRFKMNSKMDIILLIRITFFV